MMNSWRSLGGLSKAVWILLAATLVNRMGTMALPFLVLYLTRGLGLSAGRAGLVMAVYGVGALVASPLAGRLCDRVGALRILRRLFFCRASHCWFFQRYTALAPSCGLRSSGR